MTGLRRFSIALFLCAGLLFAFSSIALPYREATTQIIPDGIDDPDYMQVVGGSSPNRGDSVPSPALELDESQGSKSVSLIPSARMLAILLKISLACGGATL